MDEDTENKETTSADEGSPEETAVTPAPADAEVDALRRETADLKDQLLRRRADFENYRRRVERDREQAALDARAEMLKSLLPALDNVEKALAAEKEPSPLKEGVELIYRNLVSFLDEQGVFSHDPAGEPFDPQRHQALMHEHVPGFAEGTVVETFRKAYFLKDRLLRPALVKVARGGDGEPGTRD